MLFISIKIKFRNLMRLLLKEEQFYWIYQLIKELINLIKNKTKK